MSDLGVVALVLVSCWMAVLSIAVLLLIRQVGLTTVRLDRIRDVRAPVNDGLDVGKAAPEAVVDLLPETASAPTYFLVLGSLCAPCRELLADLRPDDLTHTTFALIGGREDIKDDVVSLVPMGMRAVTGEAGAAALRALEVSTTPMAFEVRDGTITGKAMLRGAQHFLSFVGESAGATKSPKLEIEEVVPYAR